MAFPVDLASTLTGATLGQLAYWRQTDLLVPEQSRRPRALYSFRDLVALRTVVRLRRTSSLQAVRRAFAELERMDLTDHPSKYALIAQGRSIVLVDAGKGVDLVAHPGHEVLATLEDIFEPFATQGGHQVVSFTHPREHIAVRERRLGGWPTILGTRVPFDDVAALVADGSVSHESVARYFPTVDEAAVMDAVDFAAEVRATREPA